MNTTQADLLMTRAENGLQWGNDAPILFAALKSAAQQHTNEADMLKFLKHHIARGIEHVNNLPKEH